ncbi:SusC/RagA family TonB-linked outer membrane protein [Microbacter margulisiae]|uniref:Iron complex outermembrane receptor protein n=1 Tax=Microbacter margulisiae TaxID=1350067 RepID=A0A7W5DR96_9PORP|nr:TonB-dependent receptor [Microbacter margulisiae]MBB3187074.1 iron complex outermembrane receptor protein [Microbacter margulisiae]
MKNLNAISALTLRRLGMMLVSLLFVMSMTAQNIFVKGVVKDASTGETIIGANVVVKGTTTGTITDANGNFSLTVPAKATLSVSYIGYQTVDVPVEGKSHFVVDLKQSAVALNEVVAIGYGTVKKSDLTGSVVAINADKLTKGLATSMTDLLAGQIAGVNITTDGGAPGSSASILVRGGSSVYASNQPLFVVDGVPLTPEGVNGVANPLSFINPQDIQTVTVLKDASATAIYGSRASNGVILITTKKGRLHQKLSISYDGNTSASVNSKLMDVLSADEYRHFIDTYWADASTGMNTKAALLGTANTNWQKEIYQTAISQDHNLSVSGSTGILPYRVSVGYTDQSGILKTTYFKRTTASVNLSPSFLNDDLKMNVNLTGAYIVNSFGNTGAIGAAESMDPTQPVYATNGVNSTIGKNYGNGYFMWMGSNGQPLSLGTCNPLSALTQEQNDSWVYQSSGSMQMDYRVHWLPDLHANLNLAYDLSHANGSVVIAANSPMSYVWGSDKTGSAEYNPYYQSKVNTLLDFYLNYKKTLGINSIDIMGGYSWQKYFDTSWNSTTYATNPGQNVPRVDTPEEYYMVSFYGRLNYTLLDKYLLTATIRNDGTSRFAPGNRYGVFPSAAFAWKIKDESFLKNVNWLSDLKLRLGYGLTGQQDIPPTVNGVFIGYYPYIPNYTTSTANNGAAYEFGNNWYQLIRPNWYNTNLKWETCTTYNAGVDFGFMNQRFTGSVDVYKRITNNLLNVIPVAAGTNFTNNLLQNIGSLENKGVEVTLGGRPIITHDFTWDVNLNASYNYNNVTKLTRSGTANYPGITTGAISGGTGNYIELIAVGHPLGAYYVYHQLYDSKGQPIEGAYGNGGMYISKHTGTPPWTMGFASKMTYKKWFFNFAMHADIGNYNYNNNAAGQDGLVGTYTSSGYLSNTTHSAIATGFNTIQYFSDYFIQNASFLRMDNMTLGYNFDHLFDTKLSASIYGTVQNPFVITKYKGLDPEVNGGIDNNIYPRPRVYILGLRVNF